ncbi:hypothetical protein Tco_0997727 [Tanacetum coccineum]
MGLWYPKDSGFGLKDFADDDYAGCLDTRRSTLVQLNSLGIGLDAVLKSLDAISTPTMDLRSTKFDSRLKGKFVELYFRGDKNTNWLTFYEGIYRENASHLLPLLELTNVAESLKELQDESVSE